MNEMRPAESISDVIRNYIEQFADSIVVRVRLPSGGTGGSEYRDLTIAALRSLNRAEATRVEARLVENGYLPHRVVVL